MNSRPSQPMRAATIGVLSAFVSALAGVATVLARHSRTSNANGIEVEFRDAHEALDRATDRQAAWEARDLSVPEQQLVETRGMRLDIGALVLAIQTLLSHTETSSTAQTRWNRRVFIATITGVTLMAATLYVAFVSCVTAAATCAGSSPQRRRRVRRRSARPGR